MKIYTKTGDDGNTNLFGGGPNSRVRKSDARIDSYDLAFRMQTETPEIFDLSREPQETLDLYGVGVEPTHDYGRRCLLARRLVANGVRFITRDAFRAGNFSLRRDISHP
jgi:hypothetical protein